MGSAFSRPLHSQGTIEFVLRGRNPFDLPWVCSSLISEEERLPGIESKCGSLLNVHTPASLKQ
jgi:hypothetical protein